MRERVDLGAVRHHSILPLAFDEFPLGVHDTLPSLFPSFSAVAAIKYNPPNSNFHFPRLPAHALLHPCLHLRPLIHSLTPPSSA